MFLVVPPRSLRPGWAEGAHGLFELAAFEVVIYEALHVPVNEELMAQ